MLGVDGWRGGWIKGWMAALRLTGPSMVRGQGRMGEGLVGWFSNWREAKSMLKTNEEAGI